MRAHDRLTHQQRDRAEVFGTVAAAYDRFRPSYPGQLIDDLLAVNPRRILDIGCGTGKAARLLGARGGAVLGVEPDRLMAEVARGHGVAVEVGSFEQWDDRGRRFDLITCAQAWHWVDPSVGGPKAARLLNAGGSLALFWNFSELADPDRKVTDAVYARLAPELVHPPTAGDEQTHVMRLRETGAFTTVETVTYRSDRTWSVEDWLGNLGTQSNHVLLGPERLGRLLAALRTALLDTVGAVHTSGGTYLIRARV